MKTVGGYGCRVVLQSIATPSVIVVQNQIQGLGPNRVTWFSSCLSRLLKVLTHSLFSFIPCLLFLQSLRFGGTENVWNDRFS
jgi:hypothetical protein